MSNTPRAKEEVILQDLNPDQRDAVCSPKRRTLVIAGAGSGKTEVMARRIAWWIGVKGVPRESIVAFTFTERASEEMKFRIRREIQRITPSGEDTTLDGMYIGTIHGFCLKMLRTLAPDIYHNFDVVDEAARIALIQRGYNFILGLQHFAKNAGLGQFAAIETFLEGYDLLNEYNVLDVELPSNRAPTELDAEAAWCKKATLKVDCGSDAVSKAFAISAARYYAYLHCRRFLDFSTSQRELLRLLASTPSALTHLRQSISHIVVDEAQDLNPVQEQIVRTLVGEHGSLTAVGDHRQGIYRFRGSRVEIMAAMAEELKHDPDAGLHDLKRNYRSTSRIINLANLWAKTISPAGSMSSPDMLHGNTSRVDYDSTHVSMLHFSQAEHEAEWIAETIKKLINPESLVGAKHDSRDGDRGLAYADIAILLRSSTDARLFMSALEKRNIPAIFRAGPDLFSQPEVLLFVGALGQLAGIEQFMGGQLGTIIQNVLGCAPDPESIVRASCALLSQIGLPLPSDTADRLILATSLMHKRLAQGELPASSHLSTLRSPELIDWLGRGGNLRRVFPQVLYQMLLAEAGVSAWDGGTARAKTAMFHLGQLSSLVKGIETPGWNDPSDFKYQIIALCFWGARNARTQEAPLMVAPDAVTISTIHGAKGLEFPIVFAADVKARRFPSNQARRAPQLPFSGSNILTIIDPSKLADNTNYDDERRLMYVALTRAERYLFISSSGGQRSSFQKELQPLVAQVGGAATSTPSIIPSAITHIQTRYKRELRLLTSFSDLRYYLECPHDFYLRKVLGFAPTIDQAFGYGRGVHNLMRAVHNDPKQWAELAKNPEKLHERLEQLVNSGLFFLRYTTKEPLANMRKKAIRIVQEYIQRYAKELAALNFEPEREFETLFEEEQVLVSGAIDVIRLDNPPRVTLIDFKSGESESDVTTKLDQDEMRLQVGIYGLAAKHELEFDPEQGLVRYLGEEDPSKSELLVTLDDASLQTARSKVLSAAKNIRQRVFDKDPISAPRDPRHKTRCAECDFKAFCGMSAARQYRSSTKSGS
jgi:DNA helicase-2/ATP-dependent DNA helicase PcrA